MEGIVDCQAPTVEKKEMAPVNTQAITLEKNDMVNSAVMTKLRPTILTLKYKISEQKSQIIPYLPKKPIEKSNGEPLKFGRTETFDVFLNNEFMSRNYIHINADKNHPALFKVTNFSSSKPVIVDNNKLEHEASCCISDKSVLQLEIITFFVSIHCGDQNAGKYIAKIEPEEETTQYQCRSLSFQMQNFGTCNLACCHADNSASWCQMSPQIHNSSHWPLMSPQIHSSPHLPQMTPHLHSSSHLPQMSPHLHSSSHLPQMSPQIHSSSHLPQMSPQIHSSSHLPQMSPQIHNSPHLPQMSPQIHNSLKPVFYSMNNTKQPYSYPTTKELRQRQPQEHAMPSDEFYAEKQRQFQCIENMNTKSSF